MCPPPYQGGARCARLPWANLFCTFGARFGWEASVVEYGHLRRMKKADAVPENCGPVARRLGESSASQVATRLLA